MHGNKTACRNKYLFMHIEFEPTIFVAIILDGFLSTPATLSPATVTCFTILNDDKSIMLLILGFVVVVVPCLASTVKQGGSSTLLYHWPDNHDIKGLMPGYEFSATVVS